MNDTAAADKATAAAFEAELQGDHGRAGSEEALLVLRTLFRCGPMSAAALAGITGIDPAVLKIVLKGLRYRKRVRTVGNTAGAEWETVDPFRAQRA